MRLVDADRELVDDGYTANIAVDIAQSAFDQLRIGLEDRAESATLIRADARTVRLPPTVTLWHDKATFHFLTDDADQKAYAVTPACSVCAGGYLVLAEFAADGPTSCTGPTVARHSATSLHRSSPTGSS